MDSPSPEPADEAQQPYAPAYIIDASSVSSLLLEPIGSPVAIERAKYALAAHRRQREKRKANHPGGSTTAPISGTKVDSNQDGSGGKDVGGIINSAEQVQLDDPKELPGPTAYPGIWPKNRRGGGVQEPWGGIGFPEDSSLIIPDIEKITKIQSTSAIEQLETDIVAIKSRSAEDIADDATGIFCEESYNRIIKSFAVHDRKIMTIEILDVVVGDKKEVYSKSKVAKYVEKQADDFVGMKPDFPVEQWVATQMLLTMDGHVGGTTKDYFKKARSLAQQQLFLEDTLEAKVNEAIREGRDMGEYFEQMLNIVKEGLSRRAENPYHRHKRNEWLSDPANGILRQIKDVDVVMVLDRNRSVIFFQFSDAFEALMPELSQEKIAKYLEMYTTIFPPPSPDMTRHGMHYIHWLVKHPEFDFRIRTNDPRLAKSGVYHVGSKCQTGDANGKKGVMMSLDSIFRATDYVSPWEQFRKLKFGALGACTELIGFFFRLLDPALFEKYRFVYENLHSDVRVDTRRQGDFATMRALLVNLQTDEHKDKSDWVHGFAGLVPMGSYKGADMILREFGLQIEARPGCVQLIRGRETNHSITDYEGRRFVVVMTSHEAVRRYVYRNIGEGGEALSDLDDDEMDDCLDAKLEDHEPQRRELSERERHPEFYMGFRNTDTDPSLDTTTATDSQEIENEASRKRKRSTSDNGKKPG